MHLAALLIVGDRPNDALIEVPDVEHLLRRARGVGVTHAVVMTERVTSDLMESLGRIRREGLSVDLARSVDDVAEMIHPEERVLLLPADHVVEAELLATLTVAEAPALLCLPDIAETAMFERVDATTRWAGAALLDGRFLRTTAAMVGDWDFASTLMRAAVQGSATRVPVAFEASPDMILSIAASADRVGTARILTARTALDDDGWASRRIFNPVARLLANVVVEAEINARWVSVAGLVLFGVAVLSAFAGWIIVSLVTLIVADVIERAGDLVGRAAAAAAPWQRWRTTIRLGAAGVVAVASGTTLFLRTAQWGCMLLGAMIVGADALGRVGRKDDRPAWHIDAGGYALIGLVVAAAGWPVVALAIVAAITVADLAHMIVRRQA